MSVGICSTTGLAQLVHRLRMGTDGTRALCAGAAAGKNEMWI